MYDAEMMQMLNLIHNENHMIFELCKGIIPEYEEIKWDSYEDEYKKILKQLDKYGTCNNCSYKIDQERIKDILTKTNNK